MFKYYKLLFYSFLYLINQYCFQFRIIINKTFFGISTLVGADSGFQVILRKKNIDGFHK
jgi:hypothetical protein